MVLEPNALELLPRMAEIFDEPFADSSAIPTYLVSQLAREHVKVALSGEGGDELFGGYFNYVGHRLAPAIGKAAPVLRPVVDRLPSSTRHASSLDYKAKRFVEGAALGPLERHFIWKSIFSPALRTEILQPDHRGGREPIELLRPTYDETRGADGLGRIMDVDLRVFLVEDMLVKTDRTSMARSLEARVPFLDPVITQLALSIPSRLKVRGFTKKRLLRKALAPLVPDIVLNGRKQGFSIPVGTWLRDELQPVVRDMLAPAAIRRHGVFRDQAVTRLVDEHASGQRDHSRQLWALLIFGLWFDRYAT
jgi:asparagine synthase (glutamine-hydrolysing)